MDLEGTIRKHTGVKQVNDYLQEKEEDINR